MKKKSYIIQYLVKYTEIEEKTIRIALQDFWKRYPEKGVDGICGYIVNGRWEYRIKSEIAEEVWQDVINGGKKYPVPFTQRYWVVMTDKYKLRKP